MVGILQNGTKPMPALLMRMCSGRFFSLNDLTKSLVDWKEARSSLGNPPSVLSQIQHSPSYELLPVHKRLSACR